MVAIVAVTTTRFTVGTFATDDNTFAVPLRAGNKRSFALSFGLKLTGLATAKDDLVCALPTGSSYRTVYNTHRT